MANKVRNLNERQPHSKPECSLFGKRVKFVQTPGGPKLKAQLEDLGELLVQDAELVQCSGNPLRDAEKKERDYIVNIENLPVRSAQVEEKVQNKSTNLRKVEEATMKAMEEATLKAKEEATMKSLPRLRKQTPAQRASSTCVSCLGTIFPNVFSD